VQPACPNGAVHWRHQHRGRGVNQVRHSAASATEPLPRAGCHKKIEARVALATAHILARPCSTLTYSSSTLHVVVQLHCFIYPTAYKKFSPNTGTYSRRPRLEVGALKHFPCLQQVQASGKRRAHRLAGHSASAQRRGLRRFCMCLSICQGRSNGQPLSHRGHRSLIFGALGVRAMSQNSDAA
jgi:hypothetical protein